MPEIVIRRPETKGSDPELSDRRYVLMEISSN
jgi:hypothetical protein